MVKIRNNPYLPTGNLTRYFNNEIEVMVLNQLLF